MTKKELANQDKTQNTKETNGENQIVGFVKETQEELAKVVWPSRQQLISESVAVILMVCLVALVIYLVDKFFVWSAGKVF